MLFTPAPFPEHPCEQQQLLCAHTDAVMHMLTHRQRSTSSEENCIGSLLVELPHGLGVINWSQGYHSHPTPNVY